MQKCWLFVNVENVSAWMYSYSKNKSIYLVRYKKKQQQMFSIVNKITPKYT